MFQRGLQAFFRTNASIILIFLTVCVRVWCLRQGLTVFDPPASASWVTGIIGACLHTSFWEWTRNWTQPSHRASAPREASPGTHYCGWASVCNKYYIYKLEHSAVTQFSKKVRWKNNHKVSNHKKQDIRNRAQSMSSMSPRESRMSERHTKRKYTKMASSGFLWVVKWETLISSRNTQGVS